MEDDSRMYVVGLPVIINVAPDGTVSAEVDFGDATSAMSEQFACTNDSVPDEQITADCELVRAWVSGGVFRVVR